MPRPQATAGAADDNPATLSYCCAALCPPPPGGRALQQHGSQTVEAKKPGRVIYEQEVSLQDTVCRQGRPKRIPAWRWNRNETVPEVVPAVTMDKPPLVSVVCPVFNAGHYIRETLESVLAQDHRNLEVLVVDDGSTDNTAALVRDLDPRIEYHYQANSGAAVARNLGIDASKGDLIAFIDADDLWHPRKISTQVGYLGDHPDIGLVYNRWKVIGPDEHFGDPDLFDVTDDVPLDIDDSKSGWLYETLLTESCVVHTTSAMVRREVVEAAGRFNENLRRGQDYDYWIRVSRVAPMAKLTATLSCYRINPSGVTIRGTRVNYAAAVLENAVAEFGLKNVDGSQIAPKKAMIRLSTVWRDFAEHHIQGRNYELAFDATKHALKYRPFEVRNWRALLLCLWGRAVPG